MSRVGGGYPPAICSEGSLGRIFAEEQSHAEEERMARWGAGGGDFEGGDERDLLPEGSLNNSVEGGAYDPSRLPGSLWFPAPPRFSKFPMSLKLSLYCHFGSSSKVAIVVHRSFSQARAYAIVSSFFHGTESRHRKQAPKAGTGSTRVLVLSRHRKQAPVAQVSSFFLA